MRWMLLFGRLLFGGLFLFAAVNHIVEAKAMTESLAAHSVPFPELTLALATLLLMLGGASVVLGFMPRVGLALLMLFLVPTTFIMHGFWSADAASRGMELAMFMKNLALLGAALCMFALPVPWALSVDGWLHDRTGFSGEAALARGWRRMVQGVQRRAPARAQNTQVMPTSTVIESGRDFRVYRQQAWSSADGTVVMRSVRAYFYNS
jgi:uncharacterized membrane protein YphA (DoxX/SURF4 family)